MIKKILQSPLFSVLTVAVIGFFLSLLIKVYPSLNSMNREVDNLRRKIAEVERGRVELEQSSDYFKSRAYLEKQARIKLNYKKPDENVAFVYRNDRNQEPSKNNGEIVERPKLIRNFEKWLEYLWGK